MPTFPTIHSGRVQAKYPSTRAHTLRTKVHVFCDQTEQRYAMGVPLTEFELTFRRITTADKELLRTFYVERQGETDTTWDLEFEGVQYDHCRFTHKLECTMTAPGLWDVKFAIKGFPAPEA